MTDGPQPPPRSTPIPPSGPEVRLAGPSSILPAPGVGPLPPPSTPHGVAGVAADLALSADAAGADATQRRRRPSKGLPWWTGLLFAAGVGAMLLAFVDPLLPRHAEPGRVTDRDIERSTHRSNGRTRTTTHHVVRGRTEDGDEWEIISEDLYDEADVGDRVTVEFSRLSERAVAVDGPGYHFDKAGGWLRYLYLAMAVFFAALGGLLRPEPGAARRKWVVSLIVGLVIGAVAAAVWV